MPSSNLTGSGAVASTTPGDEPPLARSLTVGSLSRPDSAVGSAAGVKSLSPSASAPFVSGPSAAAVVVGGVSRDSGRSSGGCVGGGGVTGSSDSSGCGVAGINHTSRPSSRGPLRPAVVSRALSAWEGSELEVVCLYDSNFQTANLRGQHGPERRVPAPVHIGPLSYLYRRSTQFRTEPSAEDVHDAPAMPPLEEPWARRMAVTAQPSARGGARSTGGGAAPLSASWDAAALSALPSRHALSAGGTAPAGPHSGGFTSSGSVPASPAPHLSSRSARAGADTGAAGGGGGAGPGTGKARYASGSGSAGVPNRRLNLAVDPVMSLRELVEMLEDLQVVPQLASRSDVAQLFAAAHGAATRARGPTAAAAPPSSAASSASSTPRGSSSGTPEGAATDAKASAAAGKARSGPAYASATASSGAKKHKGAAMPATSSRSDPSSKPSSKPSTATTAKLAPSSAITGPPAAICDSITAALAAISNPRNHDGKPFHSRYPSAAHGALCEPAVGKAGAAPLESAAAGAPAGAISRPQVHPDEIRFPAFKDVLVRLAVAMASASAAGGSRTAVSGSGGGGVGGGAAAQPSARDPGGVAAGWGLALSADEAAAAVSRLLGHMRLHRSDMRGLKHRLDLLARTAADHGAKVAANQLLYLAGPSLLPAAAAVAVAAAPPDTSVVRPPPAADGVPIAAGATAGTAYRSPQPWSVLSYTQAPPYLVSVLEREDRDDGDVYRPAWREFGAVALELGPLAPGELRQCRLALHNRGPHTLTVRVDGGGAPFCSLAHQGLASLPPGMPRHVEVTVQLPPDEATPGRELLGELRLYYSSSQDRREREVVVPVYGVVSGQRAGSPTTGRKAPAARSERRSLAAKATAEPVVRAVAAAAAAAAPLTHCGPRRAGSCGGAGVQCVPSAAATASLQLSGRGSGGGGGGLSNTAVSLGGSRML
ncbi:hypothetical protein GPECTOR_5g281 [Gonium pectorale]|uniref:Uncharacterized protein n=1 Tax=Gonium pectorale TaxID=33097 RepID=A0A150GWB2_GONPE|nr:hypothetical protein GPECTOR_5g281 [Gonium pectorale]|eukprot:KXZ54186.1 hypothetical protein GPECTOR_5g281 [Gonium pectorale]